MKSLIYSILFIGLLSGQQSYGCDWFRYRVVQPTVIVQTPVVQPMVYPVIVHPVVTQPVVIQPVPIVEQRVVWVWPNYYTYPVYTAPTYLRY